jgi:hypothetical protein
MNSNKPLSFQFIDIHFHCSPDIYSRRYSPIEAAQEYQLLNGAVVLRNHLGSTVTQATLLQELGYSVFPSISLNHISGGIDPRVVVRAIAQYDPIIPSKIIVDLPTITGRSHRSKLARSIKYPNLSSYTLKSETIFSSDNKLKKEVIDLLKLSCDYPIIISSGHASKEEVFELIEAGLKYNISSLLLNQPSNPLTGLKVDDLRLLSTVPFLWIEQTALTYLLDYQDTSDFENLLLDIPNLIYSSDLGQTTQMPVNAWFEKTTDWFNELKISSLRRNQICLENPSKMLLI